jgi:hypothetical protein
MKIILSRKGFDSSTGGYPSPILPDNNLVSFPIPDEKDNVFYNQLYYNERTYLEIINELGIRGININSRCHLDPDIYSNIIQREGDWRGSFGQKQGAQTHLDNNDVNKGDIFLFFGWFRKTVNTNAQLSYVGPDLHVIFGYLQIGKIIKTSDGNPEIPNWLIGHPHYANPERRNYPNNTIYIASENLSINPDLPGFGTFKLNESLILTQEGQSRSKWNLPDIFKHVEISYHKDKSWKEDYFQSTGRGQEFVISATKEIIDWTNNIILAGAY